MELLDNLVVNEGAAIWDALCIPEKVDTEITFASWRMYTNSHSLLLKKDLLLAKEIHIQEIYKSLLERASACVKSFEKLDLLQ